MLNTVFPRSTGYIYKYTKRHESLIQHSYILTSHYIQMERHLLSSELTLETFKRSNLALILNPGILKLGFTVKI